MRKRLHNLQRPQPDVRPAARRTGGRRLGWSLLAVLLAVTGLASCTDESNPLAPYEGGRALDILKVTQSFTPEMQWVGGRAGAIGVNRGGTAALDSTLVWIRTAPGDDISSVAVVGEGGEPERVLSYGGVPLDSLEDGQTYTFWVAEQAAFALLLDAAPAAPGTFADTTLTMRLLLNGRSGGDSALGVEFKVARDERITGERYVVSWTPETVRFRRLAIRRAPLGGFQDLVWHILVPDGEAGDFGSPVTIGVPPEGTQEAVAFPDSGFEPGVHLLWAVTDDWEGGFTPTAPGYAFFQIFANNF